MLTIRSWRRDVKYGCDALTATTIPGAARDNATPLEAGKWPTSRSSSSLRSLCPLTIQLDLRAESAATALRTVRYTAEAAATRARTAHARATSRIEPSAVRGSRLRIRSRSLDRSCSLRETAYPGAGP